MNEENNGAPKNKWSRIFRKKWFFPALYLAIAALLLSAVVWYQNLGPDEAQDDSADDYTPVEHDEEAERVMDQQEIIQPPVESMDEAEIITKYYDYDADQDDQENAIVVMNDRYYQSTGIDVAADDGETFDVVASLDGTVDDVKKDPLLGNVVKMKHDNGVTSHYASLEDVDVSADDKIEQGEVIGNAGESLFGKENGTHLHFEIRKDGQDVNPESFFNQPVSALDDVLTEEDETDDDSDASDGADDEESDSDETEVGPPLDNNPEEDDSTSDDDTDKSKDDNADKDKDDNADKDKDDDATKDNDTANEKSA
ncbi:hypothetical protein GCM10028778_07710 [Barrientosiimonas marina]|uniref:Peptidoglycan DD-metalloendopeptidase family protein n=1 Tax=Lentibacillus kimchii TaxID=1542911 RepID=A0ABW2UYE2_9BACI